MIAFTADPHFGHKNIIKHCNRPFMTEGEMDSMLLLNINNTVARNDTLYIVGDFAWWKCTPEQIKAYRAAINCSDVHLILGNHDKPVVDILEGLFSTISDIKTIKVATRAKKDQQIVLFHYAMKTWDQSHRKSWSLYGHSHHQLPDDPTMMSIDVGVDGKGYNYSPITLDQVEEIMAKKQWVDPYDQWEKEGKLFRPNSRLEPEHS